jgi:hypothetical protein
MVTSKSLVDSCCKTLKSLVRIIIWRKCKLQTSRDMKMDCDVQLSLPLSQVPFFGLFIRGFSSIHWKLQDLNQPVFL